MLVVWFNCLHIHTLDLFGRPSFIIIYHALIQAQLSLELILAVLYSIASSPQLPLSHLPSLAALSRFYLGNHFILVIYPIGSRPPNF